MTRDEDQKHIFNFVWPKQLASYVLVTIYFLHFVVCPWAVRGGNEECILIILY